MAVGVSTARITSPNKNSFFMLLAFLSLINFKPINDQHKLFALWLPPFVSLLVQGRAGR